MREKQIEFFWDAASPYSYLAATQIEALAARSGASVLWKPFLLGKAFEASGNRMPASVPAKAKYMSADLQLWARYYREPLNFPKLFPVNSVLALRCACAAEALGYQAKFALTVLRAYWVDGADITQPQAIETAANKADLDGALLLQQSQTQTAKDLLHANTDDAIRRDVFGAPTFFVGETMFWGNDRLALLETFLGDSLPA